MQNILLTDATICQYREKDMELGFRYPPLGGTSRCQCYVIIRAAIYFNAVARRHDEVESKILYLARQIHRFEFW